MTRASGPCGVVQALEKIVAADAFERCVRPEARITIDGFGFLSLRCHHPGFFEPGFCCSTVFANQKNFLHCSRAGVKAFQSRRSWILNLKTRRSFSAADFNSTRHDSRNMRALLDDSIEDRVEPADPAMLTFDSAEFHALSVARASRLCRGPLDTGPGVCAQNYHCEHGRGACNWRQFERAAHRSAVVILRAS